MNFLTNLNLNRNQLLNATLHNVASDPTGGTYSLGQLIFNTASNEIKYWDGTSAWVSVNSGTMSSFTLAADTGTSSTITDADTVTIAGSGSVSTAVSSGTVTISIDDVTNAELQNDSITLTNTDGHLTFANSGVVALGGSIAIETSGLVDTTTAQTIAGAKTFSDNAIFNGDLTVNGTTTTLDTTNLLVQDALIVVAKDQATGIVDAGIVIERGTDTSQAILWDESDNTFALADVGSEDGSTSGNVAISSYAKLKTGDLTVDGNITINTIGANTSPTVVLTETSGTVEKSTIAELLDGNAVESISASGTAPLNLSVDSSTGTVALSGSVDIATAAQAVSGTDTDVLLTPASLRATEDVSTITGNSVLTSFNINHNMDTRNVIVQLFDDSTFDTIIAEVTRTTVNQVTVDFGFAVPTGTTYTVLIKAIA
jgi:hypothetical protein